MKSIILTSVSALALSAAIASTPVFAAEPDDLAQIRKEMKALRDDYEQKVQSLEERLKAAEERAAKAEAATANAATPALPAQAEATVPAPPPARSSPPSQSAFNPSISIALNGAFHHVENDPGAAKIPGFIVDEEAGLPDRGFSLDESEINISANVDQMFRANLAVAFEGEEGGVAVEEAYIETLDLPGGLTAKAGRFFSGIGYLNERHVHDLQFMDANLPYRAFLGGQYGDDGISLKWIAPTDFFLQFGAEWFRGDAFPAGNADDNGTGTLAGYVRTGGDLGDESSFLASFSYLKTKAQDRDTDGDIFTGEDELGIVSAVFKWAENGDPKQNAVTLTGEYFFGRSTGVFNGVDLDSNRTGWYVQGVYRIDPSWSVGLRYAALDSDSVDPALTGSVLDNLGHSPSALSALVEYDTSEFGRLRLQYTADDSDIISNDVLSVGYTVVIGPHAAHRY